MSLPQLNLFIMPKLGLINQLELSNCLINQLQADSASIQPTNNTSSHNKQILPYPSPIFGTNWPKLRIDTKMPVLKTRGLFKFKRNWVLVTVNRN